MARSPCSPRWPISQLARFLLVLLVTAPPAISGKEGPAMRFGIVGWIILGGLAGWIASLITGTRARYGVLLDIVVGILGAFVGGLILHALGGVGVTGLNVWSLLVAVTGSVVLLWILNAIRGRGAGLRP